MGKESDKVKKILSLLIALILFVLVLSSCIYFHNPFLRTNIIKLDSKNNDSAESYWSKRLGGSNDEYTNGIIADKNNNIIITGGVNGSGDLNGDNSISAGYPETQSGLYGDKDIIISKFDTSGNYLWSKRLGSINWDDGFAVTIDSSNNIIITGCAVGNADLNGDGDALDLYENISGSTLFISKFDASGNFLWARRIHSSGGCEGQGITVDHADNIIVTGDVSGDVDFNGDADVIDSYESGGGIFGNPDIFISKYDNSGGWQWSIRLGGADGDEGHSIAADSGNNVIITGEIQGNVDLDGDGSIGAIPETKGGVYGTSDIFIAKFDALGTSCSWSKRLGGSGGNSGRGIAVDHSDNVIVTGWVDGGNADLNGDNSISVGYPETLSGTYGNMDIFMSKFNASGIYQWGKRLGGSQWDGAHCITVDGNNNILVGGFISNNNVDLNGDEIISPGLPETSIFAVGYHQDAFVSRFDTSGNNKGMTRFSENIAGNNAGVRGIATDNKNNVLASGGARESIDINADGNISSDSVETGGGIYGGSDIFILKSFF